MQTCRTGKLIATRTGSSSPSAGRARPTGMRGYGDLTVSEDAMGAQVSAARRGKEAGPAASADPDDARAERWPGIADFDDLVRRYRRELHVYCYRMLGSFDEAEDHVQEVFLRTWRAPNASRASRAHAPGCTGSPPTP